MSIINVVESGAWLLATGRLWTVSLMPLPYTRHLGTLWAFHVVLSELPLTCGTASVPPRPKDSQKIGCGPWAWRLARPQTSGKPSCEHSQKLPQSGRFCTDPGIAACDVSILRPQCAFKLPGKEVPFLGFLETGCSPGFCFGRRQTWTRARLSAALFQATLRVISVLLHNGGLRCSEFLCLLFDVSVQRGCLVAMVALVLSSAQALG